jgi:solute carrier family 25 carnitine/acylcarnitine transporter 20/29
MDQSTTATATTTTTIDNFSNNIIVKELTAASIGGMTATSVGHPLDTIKVKLQTQANKYRSGFHCLSSVVKSDGYASLFRGLSGPLYSCVFYNCIQFGTLGSLKRWISGGNEPSISQNAIAGSLSGIILSIYQTPIDQVKTILQTQNHHHTNRGLTAVPILRGPSDVLRYIYTTECQQSAFRFCRSMMRAYPASFTREFYGCAVYFGVYAFVKDRMSTVFLSDRSNTTRRQLTAADYMISGSMAGATYWLTVYPVDVIKSRMHVNQPGKYTGVIQGISKILKEEGVRPLYFGIQTTIARSICTSGVMFLCYEKILEMLE